MDVHEAQKTRPSLHEAAAHGCHQPPDRLVPETASTENADPAGNASELELHAAREVAEDVAEPA
eukprot:8401260-Alexandrium_andersonii.AAC.1